MEKIKENLYQLSQNQQLVKKGKNWRIIYPIKNRDGSINKKNLLIGNTTEFIFTMFMIGIIIFLVFSYYNDTAACRENRINQPMTEHP